MPTSRELFAACRAAARKNSATAAALITQGSDPLMRANGKLSGAAHELGDVPVSTFVEQFQQHAQSLGSLLVGTQNEHAQAAVKTAVTAAETAGKLPGLAEAAWQKIDDAVSAIGAMATCCTEAQQLATAGNSYLDSYYIEVH